MHLDDQAAEIHFWGGLDGHRSFLRYQVVAGIDFEMYLGAVWSALGSMLRSF